MIMGPFPVSLRAIFGLGREWELRWEGVCDKRPSSGVVVPLTDAGVACWLRVGPGVFVLGVVFVK